MRILTWDLELRKPVDSLMGGWEAARAGEAGISALIIKDTETGRYHIYDDKRLDQAVDHLNEGELLVGFNSSDFDQGVLTGITGRQLTTPHYDILAEIWKSLGGHRQKGYKLDDVCQRTIKRGKSGAGRYATTLASLGLWGELFDYCLGDVHITAELFNHIVDHGWVAGPNDEKLDLAAPPTEEHA